MKCVLGSFGFRFSFLIFLSVLHLLSACKKEEDYVPQKYAEESVLYPEGLDPKDALLMTIRDYIGLDLTGQNEIAVDFAYAEFYQNAFQDVGSVRLNGDTLVKTSANYYVSNVDDIDFGLESGTQNTWKINGGNGFPAFEKKLVVKMPAKIQLDNPPSSIYLNNSITLKTKNMPNNAQAIIWNLKDVDGNYIERETTGNELTISTEELQSLTAGANSLLKVAAYSLERWENNGKVYVFVNETVETAQLELK